jgi:hypothetical protein
MRATTWFIILVVFTLIVTQVKANAAGLNSNLQSCRLIAIGGTSSPTTIIGYGQNKTIALANARENCGAKVIDAYLQNHEAIPDDMIEDITTSCINLECQ